MYSPAGSSETWSELGQGWAFMTSAAADRAFSDCRTAVTCSTLPRCGEKKVQIKVKRRNVAADISTIHVISRGSSLLMRATKSTTHSVSSRCVCVCCKVIVASATKRPLLQRPPDKAANSTPPHPQQGPSSPAPSIAASSRSDNILFFFFLLLLPCNLPYNKTTHCQ